MKKTLLAVAFTALFASQAFAEPQTYKENEIEEIAMKIHHEADQGGYELLSVVDLKKMTQYSIDAALKCLLSIYQHSQCGKSRILFPNRVERIKTHTVLRQLRIRGSAAQIFL